MNITENYSLRSLNTFQLDATAKYFAPVNSSEEIIELQKNSLFKNEKKLILGGGSNILFSRDYDGLVIKNNLKGIEKEKETDNHVWVKVGSGENWHEFVLYALKNRWYGLENLSLIPGTVGAAPVQNIGAYGVELKDFFSELTAIDLESGAELTFGKKECQFGYRSSIFKKKYKNKLFITGVVLQLNKTSVVNVKYGAIQNYLSEHGIEKVSPEMVSEAVIAIRKSKLPDPEKIGNGGSFFKNPVVDIETFRKLEATFHEIPGYKENEAKIKIPAAWLIERCGWKGKRSGNAGVHELQALVLVNLGGAKGTEIVDLSKQIQKSVLERFQIKLEPEVNII